MTRFTFIKFLFGNLYDPTFFLTTCLFYRLYIHLCSRHILLVLQYRLHTPIPLSWSFVSKFYPLFYFHEISGKLKTLPPVLWQIEIWNNSIYTFLLKFFSLVRWFKVCRPLFHLTPFFSFFFFSCFVVLFTSDLFSYWLVH